MSDITIKPDDRKLALFFSMIKTVYGNAKYHTQWPSELDEEAAKVVWGDLITKHTPEELKIALKHAQDMMIQGDDDWQWPNIGLILSGAKLPKDTGAVLRQIQDDRITALPHDEQSRLAKDLLTKISRGMFT